MFHRDRRERFVDTAGFAHAAQTSGVAVAQVNNAERQIARVARQRQGDRVANILFGPHCRQLASQIAQRRQTTLPQHAVGFLGDDAEHAPDGAVIGGERAVGEGVIGFLGVAAALQQQHQALVPGRRAGVQNVVDARTDIGPDLRPDIAGRLAQRPGVLDAKGRRIGVVVKEGEVLAPSHPHRIARGDHDPQDCHQAVRPCLAGTDTRCRPVGLSHQRRDRTCRILIGGLGPGGVLDGRRFLSVGGSRVTGAQAGFLQGVRGQYAAPVYTGYDDALR